MTTSKLAQRLSAVPSTLRIPLAARASGDAIFPQVAVRDAYAADILEKIRDDGHALPEDRATIYGILARTRRFRSLAQDFLKRHPGARVVNMGCGLSHYFQWLDDDKSHMTDADLPEVLALRRELIPETHPRHDVRELDLTSPDWWEQLGLPKKRKAQPVFLFTEGVLMYLKPETVQAVLATFGERAPPGSVLAFDAMCWIATGRARNHPSVRPTGAEFLWGLRRPADLTEPHPRLRLDGTYRVMEGLGLAYTVLGPMFRMVFGMPLYAVYALSAVDPIEVADT
ncbi:O-methyltransferase involved in polyketide biosynthesis [Variovorax boronicumulans]|uniref:O-methyltransferase involved in polyketide biosynthesis n=1 Tax=Variovorax boronicumulans TaxID=436515 RepID=A0AAW8CVG6_9BURK|nr:class I SAM-dependent methyltransferase [Variovorax boronicumulans]MDP9894429.1 O-methyltransferase involved in polyketide biosynthesis [Variovorax boronicumulans]MDQ0054248.1 O-methyltransferase involved in polyketide biosynthesis [Variovorax boronicumulans]